MAIIFNEKSMIFNLDTINTTYQMKVDDYGFLLHLYYGEKAKGDMDFLLVNLDRGFSGIPYEVENRNYSMDALPQEFPCRGTGDFRSPVCDIRFKDGSFGVDLRYESHKIYDGKYGLAGLPAVYGEENMQTLEITLRDSGSGIRVVLYYGVIENLDIITRAAKVVNNGTKPVYVENCKVRVLILLQEILILLHFMEDMQWKEICKDKRWDMEVIRLEAEEEHQVINIILL